MGAQNQEVLRQTPAGSQQRIELAGLLQLFEPTERDQDALAGASLVPVVFHDLEVTAWPGGFDAEEHGDLENGGTMIVAAYLHKSRPKVTQ